MRASPRIVKMRGGLGNQLFCLAFAHAVSRIVHEPVVLDIASYASDRYGRSFLLSELAERLGIGVIRRRWLSSRLAPIIMRRMPGRGYVCEGLPPPDGAGLKALITGGVYFNGYWQDEAYFPGARAFREAARAFLRDRGAGAAAAETVIHLRTYKEEIRSARRAIPKPAYFQYCVETLEAEAGRALAINLISDDPAVALDSIGDLAGRVRVARSGDLWEDMALMLAARALILTNSSFSWWGGYCGEAGRIFYPARGVLAHYPQPARRFMVV
jgi:hypothetical protein